MDESSEMPKPVRTLTGIPAAWGRAIGRASWTSPFPDAPLVLLAHALTVEVAMTAILGKAVGVITAAGGATSHGAALLRHHSIPCVSGVAGLEKAIPSGVHVSVDGTKGEVRWDS